MTRDGLRVRRLDAADLLALSPAQWDALSAHAVTENPFYARSHFIAGLKTIDATAGLRAVAVETAAGELAAVFPYRTRFVPGFPWPVAEAACNAYQVSGMPLVAEAHATAAVGAWLDAVGSGGLPKFWTFGHFDLDSPVHAALHQLTARGCRSIIDIQRYERPRLERMPGGFNAHVAEVIPHRRLREIQRSLRRLEEKGIVAFERVTEPAVVARRLEQFLAMEHSGWKGRRGTSFLSDPRTAEFARRAYGGADGADGLAQIDSLLLDGEPIAISINIASGSTAFTPKCAYDETWRSFGPGLLLEYFIIRHFYEESGFHSLDAATTVDTHIVHELWNGRRRMARLFVGPSDWRTAALAKLWGAGSDFRTAARRTWQHLVSPDGVIGAGALRIRTGPLTNWLRNRVGAIATGAVLAVSSALMDYRRNEWLTAVI